jgi:DNA-binding PadR family transcriptional regulator
MSGEAHGYEILHFLETALGSAFRVATSQLYVLLKRLEMDGLLAPSVELQDSLPSKRIFSLTPAGRKVFLEWVQSPVEHVRDLRMEFLAKIYFFHSLSLKGGEELIRAQVRALEKVKERIVRKQTEEKGSFNRLLFGLRVATIDLWIQWITDEAAPFMKKKKGKHYCPK